MRRVRQAGPPCWVGLAGKHGGRLATFDRGIPRKAIVGADRDLVEVIAPADDG